jgi:chromosome segregation ATPase
MITEEGWDEVSYLRARVENLEEQIEDTERSWQVDKISLKAITHIAKEKDKQLAEKDMQIDRLVVTSVGDNFTIDTMEAKIKELETVIDQQEEEIMDRNYFIAELSGEFKQKWATEEMKDKLINEGLKVKERIKELEDRLDKFRGIKE